MVTPSWGSFPKPKEQQQSQPSQEEPITKDEEKPEAQKPKWGNFLSPTTYQGEQNDESDEGWLGNVARNVVRSASRAGEIALGTVGNLEKLGKDVLVGLPKHLGPVGRAFNDLVGEQRWERMVRGRPGEEQTFPTSNQLKELSETASGGYTSPKNKAEKASDELIEDISGTLAPIGRLSAMKNFVIPAVANVGKQLVDYLGFGEDAANTTKMAVWLPLMLANGVNGPKYASSLMNKGRQGIPESVQLDTPRFIKSLENAEKKLLTADPRTALARQMAAGIKNDLSNGQTSAQSLMTMYDAVNAAKRNRGLFELGKSDRNFAIKAIDQVKNAVRTELFQSAKDFPEALDNWQNGVRAWAVIHKSNALTNWVQDVARGPYAKVLSGPAAALFGMGSFATAKSPIVSGSLSASAPALYKTGQVLFRSLSDPKLRGYYYGAVSGAMAENLPAFLNNYNKLNSALKKKSVVGEKNANSYE